MQPVLRVGLTGGIGSGKSTVCTLFANIGVPVIDADEIAHYLTRAGQPALNLIVESFGPKAIMESGELDRPYLRDLIFEDERCRIQLENILHPLVFQEINRRVLLLDTSYCIICIPLLIEIHAQDKVDRILVIDSTEELQIARACQRDQTDRSNIMKIMQAQATRAVRLASADDVIHNDDDIVSLRRQVIDLHAAYSKIAAGISDKHN